MKNPTNAAKMSEIASFEAVFSCFEPKFAIFKNKSGILSTLWKEREQKVHSGFN